MRAVELPPAFADARSPPARGVLHLQRSGSVADLLSRARGRAVVPADLAMTDRAWAWGIWLAGLLTLIALVLPTFGLVCPLLFLWWLAGLWHLSSDGESAPSGRGTCGRPWWRDIR